MFNKALNIKCSIPLLCAVLILHRSPLNSARRLLYGPAVRSKGRVATQVAQQDSDGFKDSRFVDGEPGSREQGEDPRFAVLKERIENLNAPPHPGYAPLCRPIVKVPEGPPQCLMVFMHGFTSCPATWMHYTEALEHAGCLVIVPALPGHGHVNGGRETMPGKLAPEPEEYFQWIFRLAVALQEAGVDDIPLKAIGGLSFGGPTTIALALASGIQWDHVFVTNPSWAAPSDIIFSLRHDWKLSFAGAAMQNYSMLKYGDAKKECDFKDAYTGVGYCDMNAAQIVTAFFFADFVMELWTLVGQSDPTAKLDEILQRIWPESAEHGLPPWRSWSTKKTASHALPTTLPLEKYTDFEVSRELIRENILKSARYFKTSGRPKLQLVTTDKDPAISSDSLEKFWAVSSTFIPAEMRSFCALPEELPHAWPVLYARPYTYWWFSSARESIQNFFLKGTFWPEVYNTGDVPLTGALKASGLTGTCLVDALLDVSGNPGTHEPTGSEPHQYVAEYRTWDTPENAFRETIHQFQFKEQLTLHKPWRMMRKRQGKGKSWIRPVLVQPISNRDWTILLERSWTKETVTIPKIVAPHLVEQRFKDSWQQRIRKAFSKTASGTCKKKTVKTWDKIKEWKKTLQDETLIIACIEIEGVHMMSPGKTAEFVDSLTSGKSKQGKKKYNYCGMSQEIQQLWTLWCNTPY